MRSLLLVFFLLSVLLTACQPGGIPASGGQVPAAATLNRAPALPSSMPASTTPAATSTPLATATLPAASTPAPIATATASSTAQPAGVIHVDTLAQEVYPFVQNGNCSLAEAISAANLLQPVDGCAAGVDGQTVLELLPGTYRLTRVEGAPPQREGVIHTSPAGSALPVITRSLTVHGNGAVLSREDASGPFRILEILKGAVTLQDLTLQGGDAGPDGWGGAVLAENAVLRLERVRFLNNRAQNGAGLYAVRSDVEAAGSEFSGNQASLLGGGVYLNDTNASFDHMRFLDNFSQTSGGGLYANRVKITIQDSLFKGNIGKTAWGGGVMVEASTASILRSQFYHNHAQQVGGAAAFGIYGQGEDFEAMDANPLDSAQLEPMIQQMSTQIPGFQATLQAAPGLSFKPVKLDIQVHDSCFKGNLTDYQGRTNWASALSGNSRAENNYYGDPSGPGGKGPGQGDQVGRKVAFTPFLTTPPEYCDLSLAE